MRHSRLLTVVAIVLTAVVSFLAGWHFNRAASAQAQVRPFQYYRVIRLDASTTQLILAEQMSQYAESGYRFRDLRDGWLIMEYVGK